MLSDDRLKEIKDLYEDWADCASFAHLIPELLEEITRLKYEYDCLNRWSHDKLEPMEKEVTALRKIAEAVLMSADSEMNSDDWMHWHSESYRLAKQWRGGGDDG